MALDSSTDRRATDHTRFVSGIVNEVPIVFFLVLCCWCAALAAFDLRTRHLPNLLTVAGTVGVLAYASWSGSLGVAVRGGVLLALPYLVVHLVRPSALGAGDVKLALGTGAAAALGGPQAWMWPAFGAPLLTAAAATGLLLGRQVTAARAGRTVRRRTEGAPRSAEDPGVRTRSPEEPVAAIPHGPALCVTTLLGLALR